MGDQVLYTSASWRVLAVPLMLYGIKRFIPLGLTSGGVLRKRGRGQPIAMNGSIGQLANSSVCFATKQLRLAVPKSMIDIFFLI